MPEFIRPEFITKQDYDELKLRDPKYYVDGRWDYMSRAIALINDHVKSDIKTVIELGPHCFSIVKSDADVICLNKHHYKDPAYCFDAGRDFPWPVNKKYDLFIGLQVLEHLQDKTKAFAEIRKIADHAVISIPYMWKCSTPGDCHNQLNEQHMKDWSGTVPDASAIVRSRLICYYDFSKN